MKTRYVGDNDLRKYIFSNKHPKSFLNELLQTHRYLLKGIQILFANKIVHYDLKYNNIIFDSDLKAPIIIDFGQSWRIDSLKTENEISTAFFVFDQYDYWCIDILICNYIIQKVGFKEAKTDFVTEEEIDQIYDVFIYGRDPIYDSNEEGAKKKTLNDAYRYSILKTPSKMLNFKNKLDEYLQPFINKRTWWDLYTELLGYSNTWDCYSLSIIYLNMLDDAYLSNVILYNSMHTSYETKMNKYIELMESIVYATPNNRPSISNVITNIESIIKNNPSKKKV
jgi:serine/threonine protein kinase